MKTNNLFRWMNCIYDDSKNENSSSESLNGSEKNESNDEFNIGGMDPRILEMLMGDLADLKKKWTK